MDASTNIDTEDCEITHIEIHGARALCAHNGEKTHVAWAEHNRYFVVTLQGAPDVAIEIAKSTTFVS